MLLSIIFATIFVSLLSLLGIFSLFFKKRDLSKILLSLVALSAGALMADAFFELLPEAHAKIAGKTLYFFVMAAFVFFFLVEKFLFWRHCHDAECAVHPFGYMNLAGDAVHNFIDGLIIAAAFMADFRVGIATTLAVTLHEIPKEIGNFGILLHAGFDRRTALFFNFLTALTAILGGIIGYLISVRSETFIAYLLPFAAGGFIYIAASDLMPELRKETNLKKSMISFGIFLAGILLVALA